MSEGVDNTQAHQTSVRNILTLQDAQGNTVLHKLVELQDLNTIKWILN